MNNYVTVILKNEQRSARIQELSSELGSVFKAQNHVGRSLWSRDLICSKLQQRKKWSTIHIYIEFYWISFYFSIFNCLLHWAAGVANGRMKKNNLFGWGLMACQESRDKPPDWLTSSEVHVYSTLLYFLMWDKSNDGFLLEGLIYLGSQEVCLVAVRAGNTLMQYREYLLNTRHTGWESLTNTWDIF